MYRTMIKAVTVVIIVHALVFSYGEKVDTLPNWQERAVLVLSNACRMSPTEYRDAYLKTTRILLPSNYPAVAPLYWNKNLNAASRYHCAEMVNGCGMQHTCNGTAFDVRIRKFYTEGTYLAENIAAGYQTPQQVVNGWLVDEKAPGDTSLDGSGTDGHRKNIMAKNSTVLGCGYMVAGSGKSAKPYWCQDFGSGKNSMATFPIPSASHLYPDKNTTLFMLNYYDTSATTVTVTCVVDGVPKQMSKLFGTAVKGTYAVSLPVATACRRYYFEAVSDKKQTRYPELGTLVTTGEGNCAEDYSAAVRVHAKPVPGKKQLPDRVSVRHGVLLMQPDGMNQVYATNVFNVAGKRLYETFWKNKTTIIPEAALNNRCVLLRHVFTDGTVMMERCVMQNVAVNHE